MCHTHMKKETFNYISDVFDLTLTLNLEEYKIYARF